MPSSRAAILGWTGRGKLTDLQSTTESLLKENRVSARTSAAGHLLVVTGVEPLRGAAVLRSLPGVSWIAAGFEVGPLKELASASGKLARSYLKRGSKFKVEAEGTGDVTPSDVAGVVTAAILDEVRGSRTSLESPRVRFRASFDGAGGAVGVEVSDGPGGVPTGGDLVVCFVSGGIHSSVLAWSALLQGFRVRLVHARYSDEALRAVAHLYAELSHRADPKSLSLEVLEGDSVKGALVGYASFSKDPVYCGFHSGEGSYLDRIPKISSPLFLLSEERFGSDFEGLGIRAALKPEAWNRKGTGNFSVKRFRGKMADVSGVLDGLR